MRFARWAGAQLMTPPCLPRPRSLRHSAGRLDCRAGGRCAARPGPVERSCALSVPPRDQAAHMCLHLESGEVEQMTKRSPGKFRLPCGRQAAARVGGRQRMTGTTEGSAEWDYDALLAQGRALYPGQRIGRPGRSWLYWPTVAAMRLLRLRWKIHFSGAEHV